MAASTDPFAWFSEESGVKPLPLYVERRQKIRDKIVPTLA
ncbi:hypothetical protein JCM19239_1885 [Vibrio variabilis]|uniref:Uncharacterized protein n=1 Tax=Vibrio variabilis TaxID=990271 RepID=A0ABQ0J6R4_9VIBR|nr:hypothetical protein JCM19239_1885 [Vibrio variabilis]